MNEIIKVNDLLPPGYADAIEHDLTRTNFLWSYIDDVTSMYFGNNSGLSHVAFDTGGPMSEWFPFIKPLIYSIEQAHKQKLEKLFRIRVGFLTQTDQPKYEYNTPHVDFLWPHYTACYYVNDSDGDTVVFDQRLTDVTPEAIGINETILKDYTDKTNFTIADRCAPRKNSLCIFDGYRFHASTKPRHHNRRLVITVNYI